MPESAIGLVLCVAVGPEPEEGQLMGYLLPLSLPSWLGIDGSVLEALTSRSGSPHCPLLPPTHPERARVPELLNCWAQRERGSSPLEYDALRERQPRE